MGVDATSQVIDGATATRETACHRAFHFRHL